MCTSAFKLSNQKNNLYAKLEPCKKFSDPYFVNPVKLNIVVDNFFFNLFVLNYFFKKLMPSKIIFVNSKLIFYKNYFPKFVITRGPNRHKLSKDILTIAKHNFRLNFNFTIKQHFLFKDFLNFFKKIKSNTFLIDTALVKCKRLIITTSFIEKNYFKIY